MFTIVLSGPVDTREHARVALEDARIPEYPADHHNAHWGAKVPVEDGHGVLTVEHADVDTVASAVSKAGWVLRTHHHAHPKPEPDPVADLLASYERRLARLESALPNPPMMGGAVESPPWATAVGSYTAEQTRRAVFAAYARTAANNPGIIIGGLVSATDCQLSAPASGMSVNVSTGELIIGGNQGGAQGGYYARVTSQTNLSIAAASPSNPRVDLVCATVSDAGYAEPVGGSGSQWALQVITGTPTTGATLANLSGVGTLPGSSLLLGYVLVPTSATNIITANISNVANPFALQGLGGASVRGAVNIAASQSVTSTTYTTLATPDQVAGIVLPSNGLIAVWYQATWQESVAGAGSAAIFVGANQLKVAPANDGSTATPVVQAAGTGAASAANYNVSLATYGLGLVSEQVSAGTRAYLGDVSTGQAVGNGSGGPCYIFAAAGTYTISVQFKSTSGSVSAINRKMWVQALPFV